MSLAAAITAAGMTPPRNFPQGRWVRFPGAGKGRANRSGWCRVLAPNLAVYGDWSTGLTEVWKDSAHIDGAQAQQMITAAREREREFQRQQRARQRLTAQEALKIVMQADEGTHPYLVTKGFPFATGLIHQGRLVIPMRDARDESRVLSVQLIDADGAKKFLPGGRASGAAYRMGVPLAAARNIVLVEGYATGLSVREALAKLPGPNSVVVCFSARNMESVAEMFPGAVIAADNDRSETGAQAAARTGLRWSMPAEIGTDWNDQHRAKGIWSVVHAMRELIA